MKLDGIDEIHIGLNDLHLSLGLTFVFELLANGVVESLCNKLRASSVTYGFGGIACLGQGLCLLRISCTNTIDWVRRV